MTDESFDIIVYGATSFVGQIICQYLLQVYGVDESVKWALAGRSQPKLEALKAELGPAASALPIVVADAEDENALKTLCQSTRCVLSTVGPYALYGEALVKLCAQLGTDYVDLTGEVQWIRLMLERYETQAKASGARLVHCCGFDAIPSDMGVYFLQQQAYGEYEQPCQRVKCRIKAAKGGFSGGTVASLLNALKGAAKDVKIRRMLADPYSLCVNLPTTKMKQPDVKLPTFDKDFNAWLAPFLMSGINTRVVHRTNVLAKHCYGKDFQYDEALMMGQGPKGWLQAQGVTLGLASFVTAALIKPSRWLLKKFVLPSPGEGPSPEAQKKGFFDIRLFGQTREGQKIKAKVTGDQDPGYGSTAKMISEAALCLVFDVPKTKENGGFWTPASLLGDDLIKRLQEKAGLTFQVL